MVKLFSSYVLFDLILLVGYASSLTRTGCGTSKHCMSLPNECNPTSPDCLFFSWIWNGNEFEMELSGEAGYGNTYAAVAFGKVNVMQDADMYYCTGDSLESGVIRTIHKDPAKLDIKNENGVKPVTTATTSVAECSFTRNASITKTITTRNETFDLTADLYYILMARGTGSFDYHGRSNRKISDSKINMTAPTATTQAPTTKTAATTPTTKSFNVRECSPDKNCFDFPKGCEQGKQGCHFFKWSYDFMTMKFNMEITGGEGNGNTYTGIAFGSENKMQDADLYYCTGTSLESGVITKREKPPTKLSKAGITDATATTTNGVAKCTFTRDVNVTKTITSGPKDFNLDKNEYYILLAHGNIKDGDVQYHEQNGRTVSDKAIKLSSGCASIQLTKIGLAWISLLSIAASLQMAQ